MYNSLSAAKIAGIMRMCTAGLAAGGSSMSMTAIYGELETFPRKTCIGA